jgi:hypothetical protein
MSDSTLVPRTPLDATASVWNLPIEYTVDPATTVVTGVDVQLIPLGIHQLIDCVFDKRATLWCKSTSHVGEMKENDIVIITVEATPRPWVQEQPVEWVAGLPPIPTSTHWPISGQGEGTPMAVTNQEYALGLGWRNTARVGDRWTQQCLPIRWTAKPSDAKEEARTVPDSVRATMESLGRYQGAHKVQGIGHPHGDANKVRLILAPYDLPSSRPLYLTHPGLADGHAIEHDDTHSKLRLMRELDREYTLVSALARVEQLVGERAQLESRLKRMEADIAELRETSLDASVEGSNRAGRGMKG